MYKHTNSWFLTSQLKKWLLNNNFHPIPRSVLEIGSYEGMSSVYIADTLCNHTDSKLYCIDPFVMCSKDNFIHNVNICKNKDRITLFETTSDNYFKDCNEEFDFIYIDGDHSIPALKKDLINSWAHLKKGGIIWFDDYLGDDGKSMKEAVDETIKGWNIEIIHKEYQIAFKKL
jgi:predicted O-methyltransferase YrrM